MSFCINRKKSFFISLFLVLTMVVSFLLVAAPRPSEAFTQDDLVTAIYNNQEDVISSLQRFSALKDEEAKFIVALGVAKPVIFLDLVANPLKGDLTPADIKIVMESFQKFVNDAAKMRDLSDGINADGDSARLGAALGFGMELIANLPPEFIDDLNIRGISTTRLVKEFFKANKLAVDQVSKIAKLDKALVDRLFNMTLTDVDKAILNNPAKVVYWEDIYEQLPELTDAEKNKIKALIYKIGATIPIDSGNPGNPGSSTGGSTEDDIIFKDIIGHWARADIELMYNKGYVYGMGKKEFEPNSEITRAQFASLLKRVMKLMEDPAKGALFSDVKSEAWYYGSVNAAAYAKLVNGYPDGSFKPEGKITREEMAAMVVRAMEYGGVKTVSMTSYEVEEKLAKYIDKNEIGEWAKGYAVQAIDAGIIKGRSSYQWASKNNATRAEGVVMLKRLLVKLGKL